MAHLGDFGAALKELDPSAQRDTFTFFGEKFEVVADLPPMLVFTLAASMTGKVDEEEGMAAMWQAYRVSLDEVLPPWEGEGPDTRVPLKQFNRFWDLTVTKRANLDSLMELVMSLFQASGGERPTVQVPDSPPGELTTSPSSSTSVSTPPAFGGETIILDRDPSVPHLVPVSQVLAG